MTIDSDGKTIRYKNTASLPSPSITYIRCAYNYIHGDAYALVSVIGLKLLGGNTIVSVSNWSGQSDYINSKLAYTFNREFNTIEMSFCYTFIWAS